MCMHKNISRIFMLGLALALLSTAALAQTQKGSTELQLQGTLNLSLDSEVDDSGAIFINWGRFVTESNELGLTLAGFFNESGDLAGFGGPFWRYNFGSGKTVPYIGAGAFTDFGDFSSGDVIGNVEGGVRWYLESNTAFSLSGSMTYDFDTSEFNDFIQVLFGFSYFWEK